MFYNNNNMIDVSLVAINSLMPHEQHDPDHVLGLAQKIRKTQFWIKPIIVEKEQNIILDGHHRYNAAKILKLDFIPAVIVEYQDDMVQVLPWRSNEIINRDIVLAAGQSGNLLPIKTSRHNFQIKIPHCRIGLSALLLRSAA